MKGDKYNLLHIGSDDTSHIYRVGDLERNFTTQGLRNVVHAAYERLKRIKLTGRYSKKEVGNLCPGWLPNMDVRCITLFDGWKFEE